MQISTKDIRTWLTFLKIPYEDISIHGDSSNKIDLTEDFQKGFDYAKNQMFHKLTNFEHEKLSHAPELPYAESLTEEKALIVYCTPKLFEFVEKFEDVDDINLIMVGKLWLEVKKFLKEGKFKRV